MVWPWRSMGAAFDRERHGALERRRERGALQRLAPQLVERRVVRDGVDEEASFDAGEARARMIELDNDAFAAVVLATRPACSWREVRRERGI